jgi:upstream activation factor subunit UAF30
MQHYTSLASRLLCAARQRLWDYIRANKLQDEQNRRLINADDKLFAVFDKRQVTMFEMTKLVNAHLN